MSTRRYRLVRLQTALRKIGDGLRRDRENNDFGADGVDNGDGLADPGGQRGRRSGPELAIET
jgi:hypothetical protein